MLDDARGNINEHIHTLSEHLFYLKDVCLMLDDARGKISVRVNLKYHAVVSILVKVVTLKLNTMVFAKVDKHAVRHLGKSHVVE